MKKLLLWFFALCLVVGCFWLLPVEAQATHITASGTCGDNVNWVLDDTGTLTISGTGNMEAYFFGAPWDSYKSEIKQIIIEPGVTSIGRSAFEKCSSLTSITIPDSITSIGDYAFDGCSSLTNVTIPNSVTSIGYDAFKGCSNLTEVYITDLASWCKIYFGDFYANPLYYADILYLNGEPVTELTIPESVTQIGAYAFKNYDRLTNVTIGNAVTYIGWQAFSSCGGLTDITIPDSVTCIGGYAFSYCRGLTDITIGNSVTSIVEGAFDNCSSLTDITLPDSVRLIGSGAFSDCSKLKSITMPNNAFKMEQGVFIGSTSLTDVHISDLSHWFEMSFEGPYSNPLQIAKNLYLNGELVTDLVIPSSVSSINDYVFYGYQGLNSVTIPESVTSIGRCAFLGCNNMTGVYVTDLSAWCNIDFWSNPLSVAKNLYLNGELVTDLVIPDGVTKIEDYAFKNCSSLKSITIPGSVTRIGYTAFYDCSSLTGVYISDLAAWCNVKFLDRYSNPLRYAKNLYLNGELVTEIVIPDSVTKIEEHAFSHSSSLRYVEIPDSVRYIKDEAFSCCENLEKIVFLGDAPQIQAYEYNTGEDDFGAPNLGVEDYAGAFMDTTVTAYYPEGNNTWRSSVFQDYSGSITWVSYTPRSSGDLNDDTRIDNQDVETVLWHTLFPEDYPLNVDVDFNGDGVVDNQDVESFLWHILFPEEYPLYALEIGSVLTEDEV